MSERLVHPLPHSHVEHLRRAREERVHPLPCRTFSVTLRTRERSGLGGERRSQPSPGQLSPQLGCDHALNLTRVRGLVWGKHLPHGPGLSRNTLGTPHTSSPAPIFVELSRQLSILFSATGPPKQNVLPIFFFFFEIVPGS